MGCGCVPVCFIWRGVIGWVGQFERVAIPAWMTDCFAGLCFRLKLMVQGSIAFDPGDGDQIRMTLVTIQIGWFAVAAINRP